MCLNRVSQRKCLVKKITFHDDPIGVHWKWKIKFARAFIFKYTYIHTYIICHYNLSFHATYDVCEFYTAVLEKIFKVFLLEISWEEVAEEIYLTWDLNTLSARLWLVLYVLLNTYFICERLKILSLFILLCATILYSTAPKNAD